MKKILAVILTLAMIISVSPVAFAAEAADSDLVAAWNFDVLNSDNTVTDLTGNGNDLILQDSAYAIVDGFSGKTFDFNGGTSAYDNSKHLVVNSDKFVPFINGSTAVTITAFMKKEVKGSGTNFTMFALNAGSNSIMAYARAKEIAVACRSDYSSATMGTTASDVIYPNADDESAPDSWMHVAFVVDYLNDNIKIYADGVLLGEEQAEASPQKFGTDYANYKEDVNNLATGYFGIGGRHVLVDDVKVYKRALSQEEIKESIPAVLSYDFEEVCDGKIKDASAHKMDITVDETDTPTVVEGVHGNTIKLTKTATFPADTFTGMLYGAREYAVSMWIKSENGCVTGGHQIFKDVPPSGKASLFSMSTNAKKFYLETRAQITDSVGYVQSVDLYPITADYGWHHVYIEADFVNKTGAMYFDGVKKNLNNDSVSKASLNYVAGTPDGLLDTLNLTSHKKILIDDLKIYRRTLTEKEIARAAGAPYAFSNDESSVSVECYPENISGAGEEAQFILAMYDASGALKDCSIAKNASEVTLSLENIDVPADYTYQLFVLKSIESLAPVIEAVNYTAK